jgi:type I restriction enzyme M protein
LTKLRGNLEASESKHVVLGLVFLKYVCDAFTERRKFLEAATADPINPEYYVPSRRRSIRNAVEPWEGDCNL